MELTIDELAERVAVPVRTIRFYISEGLLSGPGARGKAAVYGEEHLLRLRLIRRLVEQHMPLREVREMLEPLTLPEVRRLLAAEERREAAPRRPGELAPPRERILRLLGRTLQKLPLADSEGEAAAAGRQEAPERAMLNRFAPRREEPYLPVPPPASPVPEARAAGSCMLAEGETATAWRRWQLAPGVELHVRADLVERHGELIKRLLKAAGVGDRLLG